MPYIDWVIGWDPADDVVLEDAVVRAYSAGDDSSGSSGSSKECGYLSVSGGD